ncbi:SDR family oxidoreductase [Mycobacterium sp.]|uniref:SDR family oxidoreductase n=1 Tax=Mycobacterium sp. TaxID=1785 RepID=UPI002D75D3AD|nr:NAD(P)H-binding protein [Mycobacterium sp.]HZA09763.1 NAD(P)H-binding protein [Mycobacterium sp.]
MMRRVLVTGGTGTLGRRVVAAAVAAGHDVRALSRHDRTEETKIDWRRGDLFAGVGIDDAVDGVDVVVHCATQFARDKDVVSTRRLIAAAHRAGVKHIIYVSIVGIDRIPLPYYRVKLCVEEALAGSGLGHTIVRATQFHDLVAVIFAMQRFSPVLWALRGVRFQPIDTRDVASHLVSLVDAEPAGRVADIGGPAVREHMELAHTYLESRGGRRHVIGVTAPGRILGGYRSGANLAPDNPVGSITFEDYLAEGHHAR